MFVRTCGGSWPSRPWPINDSCLSTTCGPAAISSSLISSVAGRPMAAWWFSGARMADFHAWACRSRAKWARPWSVIVGNAACASISSSSRAVPAGIDIIVVARVADVDLAQAKTSLVELAGRVASQLAKGHDERLGRLGSAVAWLAAELLILMVRMYQVVLSPILGGHCRYEPRAAYFIGAVRKYGPWRSVRGALRSAAAIPGTRRLRSA